METGKNQRKIEEANERGCFQRTEVSLVLLQQKV
jgi:hypothetical protein